MVAAQESVTKSGTKVLPPVMSAQPPLALSSPAKTLPVTSKEVFLAVVPLDLAEAAQPLLQWKRQQGFRVEVLAVDHLSRDDIRSALRQRYHGSSPLRPPQRYVLLVGDIDRIPAFNGTYYPAGLSSHATDLYYGEYTGDYYPEAFVGRLSVSDSAELIAVADKIIAYEQGAYSSAHSLLLAAGHEERTPAPTTTNGQVNYLADMVAQWRANTDTICFRNLAEAHPVDSILAALNQPLALVNYTAHCTSAGWNGPAVQALAIDTLPLATPTVFVNNCCRSNAFNSDACFGEQLLRQPAGGAVGVIGATNETLWAEDFYFAVGAKYPVSVHPSYDSLLPGAFDAALRGSDPSLDKISLGALMHAGCQAVTQSGSPYEAFYWETYTLLGDPSMTLFLGPADSMALFVPSTNWAGSASLPVHALPHSRISVTHDTTLLATALTDAAGDALISFPHGICSDSITITATRPEAVAATLHLPVLRPATGKLTVKQASLQGNDLSLTVGNVGLLPTASQQLMISQHQGQQLSSDILVNDIYADIPVLAPGADTTTVVRLDLVAGQEPVVLLCVSFADGDDSLHLALPSPFLRPALESLSVMNPDSTAALVLQPGHRYLLKADLSAAADSVIVQWEQSTTSYPADTIVYHPVAIADSSCHQQFLISLHKGNYHAHYSGYINLCRTAEDFETGDLDNLPWLPTSNYPWHIDSTAPHSGTYCLQSAPIDHGQQSVLTLDVHCLTADSVSFFYQVSSEESDWLLFYVDGKKRGYWSGNSGWQRYARQLSAGRHRLQWIYMKDASGALLDDCARIDELRLPLAWWTAPYGTCINEAAPSLQTPIVLPALAAITVAPNPASARTNITILDRPYPRTLEVFDTYGRKVDEIKIEPNCNSIQYYTTHLRSSIFTLVIYDRDTISTAKLIVKQ